MSIYYIIKNCFAVMNNAKHHEIVYTMEDSLSTSKIKSNSIF